MKKVIALLLVIAFSLSLFACGSAPAQEAAPAAQAEQAAPEETAPSKAEILYEKYSGILDALEAEDYDSVIEAVTAMKPEPTPPPVTKIDITLDNYLEYFEIATFDYDDKDAYGNLSQRQRDYFLQLKEQYSADPENPGEITVGLEYVLLVNTYKGTDFDFDTFTSAGKLKYKPWKEPRSESNTSFWWFDEEHSRRVLRCNLYNEFAFVNKAENRTDTNIVSDLEIVNISGSIYLLNN